MFLQIRDISIKPDKDWYWPVVISQLNSISRCLISPCKSLLDCNVYKVLNIYAFLSENAYFLK